MVSESVTGKGLEETYVPSDFQRLLLETFSFNYFTKCITTNSELAAMRNFNTFWILTTSFRIEKQLMDSTVK